LRGDFVGRKAANAGRRKTDKSKTFRMRFVCVCLPERLRRKVAGMGQVWVSLI
jgi:hypothetical protein